MGVKVAEVVVVVWVVVLTFVAVRLSAQDSRISTWDHGTNAMVFVTVAMTPTIESTVRVLNAKATISLVTSIEFKFETTKALPRKGK